MDLPLLQKSKQEVISLIGEQIKRGRQIRPLELGFENTIARYHEWHDETFGLLLDLFDTNTYATEFERNGAGYFSENQQTSSWKLAFGLLLNSNIDLLKEFQNRIRKHLIEPTINKTEETGEFWTIVHPEITAVTRTRFESGHYADCAEAAFKHINSVVKEIVKTKTGQELDGASLMKHAFSANAPIILIETVATASGKDTQLGYMEMFAGAMTGIRNPKAHQNIVIGRERAVHFIVFASLLMDTIDIASQQYQPRT